MGERFCMTKYCLQQASKKRIPPSWLWLLFSYLLVYNKCLVYPKLISWKMTICFHTSDSAGKESDCNVGLRAGFDHWVGKIPRRESLFTPVLWPGNSMNCIIHGVPGVGHDWATFTFHTSHTWGPEIWAELSGSSVPCGHVRGFGVGNRWSLTGLIQKVLIPPPCHRPLRSSLFKAQLESLFLLRIHSRSFSHAYSLTVSDSLVLFSSLQCFSY